MGFWDSVKGAVGGAFGTVQGEWDKFNRKDDVRAMLATMALISGADGVLEKSEKDAAIKFLNSGNVFKGFDRTYLSKTLNEFYDKCTDAFLKQDLYDEVRGVSNEADTARSVIRCGLAVASSDGSVAPEEIEVLREVCRTLNVDYNEYKQLRD
jgi:tellurite resistance protein